MTDWVTARPASRGRLWAEFLAFYLVAPVAVAVLLPPSALFPVLFAFAAVGLGLLHLTPGFRWAELLRGWNRIGWRFVAGFTAATVVVATAVVQGTSPESFLGLARANPALLAAVALLYPVLSALPQEVVFRPLFFRRYGPILPGLRAALVLNAAVFALAHLLFWSWIVAAMTFSGGLAFAWAYEARRNFPEAVVLHSLAGIVVFALGLGAFFYTGNVERPF